MASKESSFLKMVLTLFLVTFISGISLAFIYEMTKGPIAEAQLQKKLTAIKQVTPDFDNNPYQEAKKIAVDKDTCVVYPAKQNNTLAGIAVLTTTNKGFSGEIKLMVGFLPDGSVNNIVVVSHNETPGLGDKIEQSKSSFSKQFKGKNPEDFELSVKKDGGDVDAITAATISSRAYCDAVERAYKAFKEFKNRL
jgi:electron transport complex protein RnfG